MRSDRYSRYCKRFMGGTVEKIHNSESTKRTKEYDTGDTI